MARIIEVRPDMVIVGKPPLGGEELSVPMSEVMTYGCDPLPGRDLYKDHDGTWHTLPPSQRPIIEAPAVSEEPVEPAAE